MPPVVQDDVMTRRLVSPPTDAALSIFSSRRRDGDLFRYLIERFATFSGISGVQPKELVRDETAFAAQRDARLSQSYRGATHIVKFWEANQYPPKWHSRSTAPPGGLPRKNFSGLAKPEPAARLHRLQESWKGSQSPFIAFLQRFATTSKKTRISWTSEDACFRMGKQFGSFDQLRNLTAQLKSIGLFEHWQHQSYCPHRSSLT
jgi:hypothetical protein